LGDLSGVLAAEDAPKFLQSTTELKSNARKNRKYICDNHSVPTFRWMNDKLHAFMLQMLGVLSMDKI